MHKRCVVVVSKFAEKQLRRIPKHIREALYGWAGLVEINGIYEVRRLPGYRDEPLYGQRTGERSVRLSRAYRVIYVEEPSGEVLIIGVREVSKHDY